MLFIKWDFVLRTPLITSVSTFLEITAGAVIINFNLDVSLVSL